MSVDDQARPAGDRPSFEPPGAELPGSFPYTRGVRRDGHRTRPWTMRQYAGFASAEQTNARFRLLLARGQTGLSTAFDLPTQLGLDSDDPRALGEVGRTGVAIDSVDDMARMFDGIPLGEVSTSMTINAPASVLLLLYELVGERQGVAAADLSGTIQNDVLKEYAARGNYIFPPRAVDAAHRRHLPLLRDRLPRFNTISISGYHIREAGSSAAQELAFTLANGIAYVEAAMAAGLEVDDFARAPVASSSTPTTTCSSRWRSSARRARFWAQIMRDRFGARDERSLMLRFHAQTGGSTLTAQQPENNIVRVALQAFAAAAGGCQSLHTNGVRRGARAADRALGDDRAAHAADPAGRIRRGATADPFGGSWYVEALTDALEREATTLIARDRRARRRRRRGRERLDKDADRGRGLPRAARDRVGRAGHRRRQPLTSPTQEPRSSSTSSTRHSSAARSSACRRCGRARDGAAAERALAQLLAAAREGESLPARADARRRSRRWPRSARSAACCARRGARTIRRS